MFDRIRILGLLRGKRDSTTLYLVILLLTLTGVFSVALPGQFFRIANLQSMASQIPELGILAMAMMITMLSGGINLAIIASANMAGIMMAFILTYFIAPDASATVSALMMAGAVIAGLTISILIGLLNGWIIAYLSVSPILATLGTMTLIQGLNLLLTKGYVISGFPEPILFIGNGEVLGIPMPILIFIACALFMSLILRKTPFGVSVYMMGSNEKATLFSGIRVNRVTLKIYALSGLYCGIAALIMISRFNSAKAGYASSYLLVTILAAVLGGVDPFGGFGRMVGLVLALITLQVISSGLNLLGMSAHLTIALWGGILLLILFLNQLRNRLTPSKT